MADHYENHRQEFARGAAELRDIFDLHSVDTELDGDQVAILHTGIGENTRYSWPDGDNRVSDSILRRLDVTPREFARIDHILAGLDCIGFRNFREEDEFAFQRAGFGMYTYLIFPAPQDKSSLRSFEASGSHSIHSPRVIFQCGSGAIGSDCLSKDFYE